MGGVASGNLAKIRMFEVLEHIMESFPHRNKIAFCARFKEGGIILYNGTTEELEDFIIWPTIPVGTLNSRMKFR